MWLDANVLLIKGNLYIFKVPLHTYLFTYGDNIAEKMEYHVK